MKDIIDITKGQSAIEYGFAKLIVNSADPANVKIALQNEINHLNENYPNAMKFIEGNVDYGTATYFLMVSFLIQLDAANTEPRPDIIEDIISLEYEEKPIIDENEL
jgi:uncharacterized protein Smg (DUF494 family)